MKHYFLILPLLLVGFAANSQSWNGLNFNDNQPGLETNPLKGFVDLFEPSNNFPNSISASLFKLDDLMLGIDKFNWSRIDNYLDREARKGNHSYIQVNIDPANGSTDMPAFLVDQIEWHYYPGDSGNNIAPDSCPNWNNQLLMDAMLVFIDSFGTRYNNDDRVFMVHLGLYGMWGEWHIGDVSKVKPEFEMTEANRLVCLQSKQTNK